MPTIHNPRLSVTADAELQRARIVVQCNVHFTDFEVNSMNRLGLRYTLRCRVVNKDLWYETTTVTLEDVELPRRSGMAASSEEVVFEASVPLDALREHMFTRDDETGAEQVARSNIQTVDLAA